MASLPADAKPPKSKTQPYYSIHPLWTDVEPILQSDAGPPGQPDPGPALATIAYTPRYSEAMSYLRAVMAANEFTPRCLALTEDLIGMNPAHYTVWLYRMAILKHLWGVADKSQSGTDAGHPSGTPHHIEELDSDDDDTADDTSSLTKRLWTNISNELTWLNALSTKHLKNYQIWHHRHALVELIPTTISPQSPSKLVLKFLYDEQRFLAQILSLDTKNYHVWSYRQWLCCRYPVPLIYPLPDSPTTELAEMDIMIEDDIRNNSAWNHRYLIVFGHSELAEAERRKCILKEIIEKRLIDVDPEVVDREIQYTKAKIRLAPQNGSSWNYLLGIRIHAAIPLKEFRKFCEEFLGEGGDLWMDQYVENEWVDEESGETVVEREQKGVRSSHAVEWLSEIYGEDGTEQSRERCLECLKALREKWDPIRKGYWDYRVNQFEERWKKESASTTTA